MSMTPQVGQAAAYSGRPKGHRVEGILALGTAQLGLDYGIANKTGLPKEPEAIALIRHAIEQGMTWIDTARAYGIAERRIGSALSGRWWGRGKIVTKLDPLAELPEEANSTAVERAVDRSLLQSLHELRAGYLDVVLLHRWAHRTSHGEKVWRRLLALRSEGMCKELGASLYNVEDAMEALSDPDCVHLQIPFNLIDHRWLADDFQARLRDRPDVRIHARSVFLQGLLVGEPDIWPDWVSDARARTLQIDNLANELGRASRSDLCLAFAAAQSWIDSLVVGAETLQQLDANLKAVRTRPLAPAECAIVVDRLGGWPSRLLNPSEW